MNYRHAFHAGNFADVLKHAVLARVLAHLALKPGAFRVLDTHAGTGLYDLRSEAALRSPEWREGIARVTGPQAAPLPPALAALLDPYLGAVRAANGGEDAIGAYPGSPAIIRHMLRRQDRLTACELHPQDAATLKARFAGDRQARIVELDGWLALGAFLPPKERRGAVIVDPPFEKPDEFAILAAALAKALGRWPGGTYLAWYPLKDPRAVGALFTALAPLLPGGSLRVELDVARPEPGGRLAGSGLLLVNPPFTLEPLLAEAGPLLAERLAQGAGAAFRMRRATAEAAG